MNRTKIEWVKNVDGSRGYSWNPIQGLCPVDCKTPDGKSYCYARKMYKRFKREEGISLKTNCIEYHGKPKEGSRIFVCSTMEIFHPQVPKSFRDFIFRDIEAYPKLTFIILTKMPERIDRSMPENVRLGVTVESAKEWHRARTLACFTGAKKKFISFEPILGPMDEMEWPYVAGEFDWFILGRLTGHGKKNDPSKATIRRILEIAHEFGRPVFMKNNLRDIWGPNLIQEFPK